MTSESKKFYKISSGEPISKESIFFKVTNETENHNDFQYKSGLNVLKDKFNDDPKASCCAGGLYFTTLEYIHKYYSYGVWLREVTLPVDDPDFKMVKDSTGDKWRANKLILDK